MTTLLPTTDGFAPRITNGMVPRLRGDVAEFYHLFTNHDISDKAFLACQEMTSSKSVEIFFERSEERREERINTRDVPLNLSANIYFTNDIIVFVEIATLILYVLYKSLVP